MKIELEQPSIERLGDVISALRSWQRDDVPLQLHPGDIGWFWRFGSDATAKAVRVWSRSGEIVAVGLLDGPDLLRLTTTPELQRDSALARQLVHDIGDSDRTVLPAGKVFVETPNGALAAELLLSQGWKIDDPWTPLSRPLSEPVDDCGLRIEVVGPAQVHRQTTVHRAAFGSPRFTDESWHQMAAGPAYTDGRCLIGFDRDDNAVATVTVWSAGAGKPGLLEPMGVHPDHRGQGHGRAITLAAAAALRSMGSSSAQVCTPSDNAGAVATYRAAGFGLLPQRRDCFRDV